MRRLAFMFVPAVLLFSPELIAQGKFSGYMFGDYFYNAARDTGISSFRNVATGGEKSLHGFRFRRIYFTYDAGISEKFAARFRLEADEVSNTSDGKIGVAVKDAYLRWKDIFKGSDLYFGIHPTPAFAVSEDNFGYRALEKTIMDLRGIVSSRDLGVSLKGSFDDGKRIRYWFMIGNGAANKPETDKYKRYYLSIHVIPVTNLEVTLYGDYRDAPRINAPGSTAQPPATLTHGTATGAVFAGFRQPDRYSIGAEAFFRSLAHGYAAPSSGTLTSLNTIGFSVWASLVLQTDLAAVVRFDHFDPNSNGTAKGDARNYYLAAVDWKPEKDVSIMPNILVETYEPAPGGRAYDPSITARITLFYSFL